jgi:folate-binding protein YgfZ
MSICHLNDRALLSLTGKDSRTFLQGLVSNNVRHVSAEKSLYTALLTPQGKFLFDFFIIQGPEENTLWLDVAEAQLPDLLKRLKMYKLRSDVTFTQEEALTVHAAWNAPFSADAAASKAGTTRQEQGVTLCLDPRHTAMGTRLYGTKEAVENWLQHHPQPHASSQDYNRLRLEQGVPLGGLDVIPDKSLLLEYHFEGLNGVDFLKGCYVGQEVTARSKHRATLRKVLHQVKAESGALPAFGETVYYGDKPAGEMLSSQDDIGLALLRVEETTAAAERGELLQSASGTLSFRIPDYALPFWKAAA